MHEPSVHAEAVDRALDAARPRFSVIRSAGRIVPNRQWHVHDYVTGVVARLDDPDRPEGPLAYFTSRALAEQWVEHREPLQLIGCDLCDRLLCPRCRPCQHLASAEREPVAEAEVRAEAERLAEQCGCRRWDVHEGVARARLEIRDDARRAMGQLDGTSASAVALLTGVPVEKLGEYGGMPEQGILGNAPYSTGEADRG